MEDTNVPHTRMATLRILEFFGVESSNEVIEQEGQQLNDSVMDGFCAACGAYFGFVEPDADGYHCEECGQDTVSSLLYLLGIC